MPKVENQQAYWNSRAKSWGEYDVPLIPSPPELEFQRKHLTRGGDILILGVTPQLCALALEVTNKVTAVDFAQGLIDELRIEGVDYVCQDWINFFENTKMQYDNIVTDGGLLSLRFPDHWDRLITLIHTHLRPGGTFSPRIYLSTSDAPKEDYDNPNLTRFVPRMANLDENWMVQITGHQDYKQYDVRYTFPPRNVALEMFSQFELKDEFVPDYEEGDRFVSFAFQRQDGV